MHLDGIVIEFKLGVGAFEAVFFGAHGNIVPGTEVFDHHPGLPTK